MDSRNKDSKPLYVTSPLMPDYDEFTQQLKALWESHMLTNNGSFLRQLEEALGRYLGEKYISVYSNGTLPLLAACRALRLKGDVITTPYTFIATSHSLMWCGLRPVFADVDPLTGTLDPAAVEAALTPRTCAILPVHVYGRPCDTEGLSQVAHTHGLPLIYDAAHAFGVRKDGISLTSQGDIATLSFHATKVFNTLEGGAVICRDSETKSLVDRLRNFGFESETRISAVGINAKMDEMRALFGLLNLKGVDDAIASRRRIDESYRRLLAGNPALQLPPLPDGVTSNYSHFPVLFSSKQLREEAYSLLRRNGIYPRRYFYPLVTDFHPYDKCPGAGDTPIARSMADRVLCLPLHTAMTESDTQRIAGIIARVTSCGNGRD